MRQFPQIATPGRRTWATFLSLLLTAAAPSHALTITQVSQSASQVGLYQPLTVRFNLSRTYTNPYDPGLIDASFEFTGPSGTTRLIPAFWSGESPPWMARIVPLELGPHTCRIVAKDYTGETAATDVTFTATASNERGFIHIDPRNPRYLRYDNGQPYRPVGQNLCWYGRDSLFLIWLNNMQAAGQNWTRYWMVPYVWQGIEWGANVEPADQALGRYSQNQSRMFDTMLTAARDRGIAVQLCMDSFNAWNPNLFSNWAENPYNAANGGMCTRPIDYFLNAEAKRLAKQQFRYIVARWAYNTGLLCWEFWNEVDAVSGGGAGFFGNEQKVADWHREMARYIRSIDPFAHPITTSFADDGPRSSYAIFWQMPEMDIVQLHQYSILLPESHISLIRWGYSFGKPVIMGEGNLQGNPDELETQGYSIHLLSWAGAVEQSGVMPWWWDNWIYPNNLYGRFKPIVAYLKDEDWAPQNLGQLSASLVAGPSTLQLYGASGPNHAYLFLRGTTAPITGVRVRLNSLTAGAYKVEHWNTYTGLPSSSLTITTDGAPIIDVPTFSYDTAIKVKVTAPFISASPASLSPQTVVGSSPPDDQFDIRNSGGLTLNYAITVNADWLSIDPASGSSTGETDVITVRYQTALLPPGDYQAAITVTAPAAPNSPQVVMVALRVQAAPGDFDGDKDVDQTDFGWMQTCLMGPGVPQADAPCAAAHFDTDGDVDQDDMSLFVSCMTGADQPADPHCGGR